MKRTGENFLLPLFLAAMVALAAGTAGDGKMTMTSVVSPPVQLILDAGHGGEDGGAVSCTGVPESRINLSIVRKLDQLLGFYGEDPILLRSEDISLHSPDAATLREKKVSDLHNRVDMIEGTEGGVLISIHQNTYPEPAYHGAQVFYRTGAVSQALAAILQDRLRAADPENQRTPAQIPDSVYLMKNITCPAALIECGFLSNPAEESRLCSDGYQSCLSVCILAGWLDYLEKSGDSGMAPVV